MSSVMMIRTTVILLACALAVAPAVAAPKAKTSTLAISSASITGKGPELVRKVKRASAKSAVVHECDGAWTVHYAVALAAPVPSAELTLRISDVTAAKEPIATRRKIIYSEAVVARGMLKLDRDDVRSANAKLLLEIESDGVAIARQTFFIQGSAQAAQVPINFTADEAASDDEVAAEDVRSKRE
jgi:hypothetical protein